MQNTILIKWNLNNSKLKDAVTKFELQKFRQNQEKQLASTRPTMALFNICETKDVKQNTCTLLHAVGPHSVNENIVRPN